ncbi:MAG: glycosyltransferase family 4 protein [Fibrobacteria bacterium]|nr:glycosyltransferase family 4 protein [Fibrobacteria bacterium]
MHILYIDPEPPGKFGGGIRTYIATVAALCKAEGHIPVIFTHTPEAYSDFTTTTIKRKPVPWPGIRYMLYRFFYPQNILLEHAHWIAKALQEYIVNHSKDEILVEFCDFHGYAFFSLKNSAIRKRSIIRIHTPAYLTNPQLKVGIPFLQNMFMWVIEKHCLKKAQRISAPSADFVSEKLKWVTDYSYIPNPLPFFFHGDSAPGPECADKNFLYCGRIEYRKGVHILLDAFTRLIKIDGEATLTLAGKWDEGVYGKELLKKINTLPAHFKKNINIQGEVSKSKLQELFKSHSCCIIPSMWENSPYGFFEAFCAGLICIGAKTGEMGAILPKIDGLYFEAGNTGALFDAMLQYIKQPGLFSEVTKRQLLFLKNHKESSVQSILGYYYGIIKEIR